VKGRSFVAAAVAECLEERPSSDGARLEAESGPEQFSRALSWSALQAHILTGGGRAEDYYTAARGFPYSEDQLPHHFMALGSTHEVFSRWRWATQGMPDGGGGALPPHWLTGAWYRPIFRGGGKETTDATEACVNLVTPSIFVDIRIPTIRDRMLHRAAQGSNSSQDGERDPQTEALQMRLLARQHAFGGYGRFSCDTARYEGSTSDTQVHCTRHHAIDWNYLGKGRPRPNRWGVVALLGKCGDVHNINEWREDSFATGDDGRPYYYEIWRRLPSAMSVAFAPSASNLLLAMRTVGTVTEESSRDTILVASGGRFGFVSTAIGTRAREMRARAFALGASSRAAAVDAAISLGDLELARWLVYDDVRAGHGLVSACSTGTAVSAWRIEAALQPINEGRTLAAALLAADSSGIESHSDEAIKANIAIAEKDWCSFLMSIEPVGITSTPNERLGQPRTVHIAGIKYELFECSHATRSQ